MGYSPDDLAAISDCLHKFSTGAFFLSGSLLLLASVIKGIPTSLVQVNVAAILGIGVAKMGHKNIFRKTQVKRFFTMWMIAPVISFLLSLLLIFLADKANLL